MFKKNKVTISFLLLTLLLVILAACGDDSETSGSTEDYPEENQNLDYLIAFDPGGGNDTFSRKIIEIIEEYDLYPGNIVPENMGGGSGATGYTHFKNTAESDPYNLTSTSGNFITTPLVSDTEYDYESFTSVALLATETPLLVVSADSEFETLDDFVETAKEKQLSVGGSGAYGPDRIVTGLFEKEADIELEFVPFDTSSEGITSVLSGGLDAQVSNLSEVLGQIESEDLKALAYSAEDREFDELPDVPTFKESGYDFTFEIPRGVYLPGDIPEEAREWWIETLKKVEETDEWQEYLENNMLNSSGIYGDEYDEFMNETVDDFETVLE